MLQRREMKMDARWLWLLTLAALPAMPARAQFDSGSVGSDGEFVFVPDVGNANTMTIDLSFAASTCDCDGDGQVNDPCRWDCASPVPGRGVYDKEQWAVVFKYSTITVPADKTVKFANHSSGAPVVWLSDGDVTIAGTINLDGQPGSAQAIGTAAGFALPGPGGFPGGQRVQASGRPMSAGFGPGGGDAIDPGNAGGGGHVEKGGDGLGAHFSSPGGKPYGYTSTTPLIGGSGGGGGNPYGGGGGGGALLLASGTRISMAATGLISADGGSVAGSGNNSGGGGGGSGGAIRLIAPTFHGPGELHARGGTVPQFSGLGPGRGSKGRIDIEATDYIESPSSDPPPFVPNTLGMVFPPDTKRKTLHVTGIDNASPASLDDPQAGILSTEAEIDNSDLSTIYFQAEHIDAGQRVEVQIMPLNAAIIRVCSTPVDANGTATATVRLPPGRNEIQLHWPVRPGVTCGP